MTKKARTSATPKITAVDLFCGVGGLTHGLVRGGIDVVAGIDVDPSCRFPFEANNAATFLERDVDDLSAEYLKKLYKPGNVSLLAGCAPCQPFSSYSRSKRNQDYELQWPLVSAFGKLVERTRPDLVTMENVPQLLDHIVFKEFVASLSGYKIWWSVVECSSLGIPQTRKRLVLLASRFGDKGLSINSKTNSVMTVRNAIEGLPYLKAGDRDPADALHAASKLSSLNLRRIKASVPGGTWRDWPSELQAACHQRASGATYPSVYGRMEWDRAGPTVTTQCFGYGNGRFGHPEQDRAITLREAAILQTFPRDYQFAPDGTKIKFSKMGRLIGNAVPVRLGEVIAETLVAHARAYL
jgi:DNA (cytosine-5)-methyltransferase 1